MRTRIITLSAALGLMLSSSFASIPVTNSDSLTYQVPSVSGEYEVALPQWMIDFSSFFTCDRRGEMMFSHCSW